MASRHSVDLHYNPRRFSDLMLSNGDFSWHSGRSLLDTPEDPSQSGFAAMHSEKSSSKIDRRRSFHGGELMREPGHKPKTSAPVSVVGLGCWAPSQSKGSMKSVKQHAHYPLLEVRLTASCLGSSYILLSTFNLFKEFCSWMLWVCS